jgi:hypothetical protein
VSERGVLLITLDRLFAGPRDSLLSLDEFLRGLNSRSYPFMIAALNLPNCIPTGIPGLSTVTGIPMLLLLAQYLAGRPSPSLPRFVGQRSLPRGRLQSCLESCRRYVAWLEDRLHPRLEALLTGLPRRCLLLAWTLNIVVLALPIPFDNLFPAWAILFFCLALVEDDGVMALLGWILTAVTGLWTAFLLVTGPYVVLHTVRLLLQ